MNEAPEEAKFPYKRGETTLALQHILKAEDFKRQNRLQVWDKRHVQQLKQQHDELKANRVHPRELGRGEKFQMAVAPTIVENKSYVLIVEDNQMVSMTIQEMLKIFECVGIVAENGRIGVEKFTSFLKDG